MLSPKSWQPLETAPKDGSEILTYNPQLERYAILYWRPMTRMFESHYDGTYLLNGWWMPLPEAPRKPVTMPKYRRKPELVEAVRVLEEPGERIAELLSWIGGDAYINGSSIYFNGEPWHAARQGEWVLKNEKGKFSALSHAQFMERYEPI